MTGIACWWHFALVVVIAVAACFTFAAATQRYFIVTNRWRETVLLLLVAFSPSRSGAA